MYRNFIRDTDKECYTDRIYIILLPITWRIGNRAVVSNGAVVGSGQRGARHLHRDVARPPPGSPRPPRESRSFRVGVLTPVSPLPGPARIAGARGPRGKQGAVGVQRRDVLVEFHRAIVPARRARRLKIRARTDRRCVRHGRVKMPRDDLGDVWGVPCFRHRAGADTRPGLRGRARLTCQPVAGSSSAGCGPSSAPR